MQFWIDAVKALFVDFTWKRSKLLFISKKLGEATSHSTRASVADLNLHRFKSRLGKFDRDRQYSLIECECPFVCFIF